MFSRSQQSINLRIVLYVSYHNSDILFVQFCTANSIGIRYLNASTWVLRLKGVTVGVKLTVELVTKRMHEHSLAMTDHK